MKSNSACWMCPSLTQRRGLQHGNEITARMKFYCWRWGGGAPGWRRWMLRRWDCVQEVLLMAGLGGGGAVDA